jgi:hypothetical protein
MSIKLSFDMIGESGRTVGRVEIECHPQDLLDLLRPAELEDLLDAMDRDEVKRILDLEDPEED